MPRARMLLSRLVASRPPKGRNGGSAFWPRIYIFYLRDEISIQLTSICRGKSCRANLEGWFHIPGSSGVGGCAEDFGWGVFLDSDADEQLRIYHPPLHGGRDSGPESDRYRSFPKLRLIHKTTRQRFRPFLCPALPRRRP